MANIDESTLRGWPLPHLSNKLYYDNPRIRAALALIDLEVSKIEADVGKRALQEHRHEIGDTNGLETALSGLAAKGHAHFLNDLSDVTVTGAVNGQVLGLQGDTWVPLALRISHIDGLQAALDGGSMAGTIAGAGAKKTPVNADLIALVDSADGNTLKALSWGDLKAAFVHGHDPAVAGGAAGFMTGADKTKLDGIAGGADVTSNALGPAIAGAAAKAAPVDTDLLPIAEGTGAKRISWAVAKATLKAFFDGIYQKRVVISADPPPANGPDGELYFQVDP